MTETLTALRQRLLLRYDDFKARLTRRLGSADLAGDALQDMWLRLERNDQLTAVRRQDAYLFRVAVNVARDHQRAEKRRLTVSEIETLLEIADETPDPARVVESRSDLRALQAAMEELPPRQRAILLAARIDGQPRRQIAKRYRISLRLVQRELQEAQDYCAGRLKRQKTELFTSTLRETSEDEGTLLHASGGHASPGTDE